MIPKPMNSYLRQALPEQTWRNRLRRDGSLAFMEFGPLDVDRLQRLGIEVDNLGPHLVVCMWDEESALEIGGYLVVEARKLLSHLYAWEGLKQALQAGEIRIASLQEVLSRREDVREWPIEDEAPAAFVRDGRLSTWPHRHGIDGAFAARLRKRSEAEGAES